MGQFSTQNANPIPGCNCSRGLPKAVGTARGCAPSWQLKTCYFDPVSQTIKKGTLEVTRDPATCQVTFDGVRDELGAVVNPRPTQVSCDCTECPAGSASGQRAQVFSQIYCRPNGDQIMVLYQWDGSALLTLGWRQANSSTPLNTTPVPADAGVCAGGGGGPVARANTFHAAYPVPFNQTSIDVGPDGYTPQVNNHQLEVNGVIYQEANEVTFSVAGTVLSWAWVNPLFSLGPTDTVVVHPYVSN